MNTQNSFSPFNGEKKTPWYLQPDVSVPKGYDPYEDDCSAFAQIYSENPFAFGGPDRLDGETPDMFEQRKSREAFFAKQKVAEKIKHTVTSICLVLWLTMLILNSLVSALAGFSELINEQQFTFFTDYILPLLQYLAVFPIVFIIATLGKKNKTKTFFGKPKTSAFFSFRFIVITIGFTYVAATFSDVLFSIFESYGLHTNNLMPSSPVTLIEHILYFAAVVICAPIFEEILFRGILQTRLAKFGGWFAVITQGILFGLYHQYHAQLLFASVFGIFAGFIAMRAHSIIPTVIAHICLNGFSYLSTLLLSFTNYEQALADPTVTFSGPAPVLAILGAMDMLIYAVMLLSAIMLVVELAKNRHALALPKCDVRLSGAEKLKAFFANPVTILFLIVIISNLVLNSFIDIDAIISQLDSYMQMA